MKVFVIGGGVPETDIDPVCERELMTRIMVSLGQQLEVARFPLIICSPYDGAADVEVLRGWSGKSAQSVTSSDVRVEIHCPDDRAITEAVRRLQDDLRLASAQIFLHPSSRTPNGKIDKTYSWLLAQMSAMDRCNAIVAIGGNPSGSANLLLQLAAARRIPVLPLGHIGGAAAAYLERHRYELQDRLGNKLDVIKGPHEPRSFRELLEELVRPIPAEGRRRDNRTFFISYARTRPAEADFVEMTLRRRHCTVHRDEHAFEPGGNLLDEIKEGIYKAGTFLALWSKDYACSPWCNDELELALDRAACGSMRVAILDLDGTRIVPRRARGLVACPAGTRPEIEAALLRLIEMDFPTA